MTIWLPSAFQRAEETGQPVDLGTKTVFARAVKFVEKPDARTARRYLASRRYVWNAGMFVWRVATMKSALLKGAPALAILEATVAAARGARTLDGLGMLVNQGAINYELWTGVKAPRDVMYAQLKSEFAD